MHANLIGSNLQLMECEKQQNFQATRHTCHHDGESSFEDLTQIPPQHAGAANLI
jgi:hypothetical protein